MQVSDQLSPALFLGFYDYEWSAISAIATGVAVVVALAIPIALEWRRHFSESKRIRERYREVVSGTDGALETMRAALGYDFREMNVPPGLRALQATARLKSQMLRILARQPGISDGAIDSLVGARLMLESVERAASEWQYEPVGGRSVKFMEDACYLAAVVEERIEAVANYRLRRFLRPHHRTYERLPLHVLIGQEEEEQAHIAARRARDPGYRVIGTGR